MSNEADKYQEVTDETIASLKEATATVVLKQIIQLTEFQENINRVSKALQPPIPISKEIDEETDSDEINEFIEKYQANKSYFATTADWYGQQRIWTKILIGAIVVVISYALHLFYVLAGAAYSFIALVMDNHHRMTKEQEELITRDLRTVKKELNGAKLYLQEITQSIESALKSLNTLSTEITDINIGLNSSKKTLEDEVAKFKDLVQSLTESKNKLERSTKELQNQLSAAYAIIETHEKEMSRGVQSIRQSDHILKETCDGFRESLQNFDFVSQGQANMVELLKVKITMLEQQLSKRLSEESIMLTGIEQNDSADEFEHLSKRTDEILEKGAQVLADSNSAPKQRARASTFS